MKKQLLPLFTVGMLIGCGEVAETAIQGAAEAVANKKNQNNQVAPPPNNL